VPDSPTPCREACPTNACVQMVHRRMRHMPRLPEGRLTDVDTAATVLMRVSKPSSAMLRDVGRSTTAACRRTSTKHVACPASCVIHTWFYLLQVGGSEIGPRNSGLVAQSQMAGVLREQCGRPEAEHGDHQFQTLLALDEALFELYGERRAVANEANSSSAFVGRCPCHAAFGSGDYPCYYEG
jgi:hypothetical protein